MGEYSLEHESNEERIFWNHYLEAIDELSELCDPEIDFYEEVELVRDEDKEEARTRLVNTYVAAISTSDDLDDAIEFVARHGLLESDD